MAGSRVKMKAPAVNDQPIVFYDIMPTFCDLIGVDNYVQRYRNAGLGEQDYFDGLSFAPTLLGHDERQQHHDFLYWEFHETDQIAVRQHELLWKQSKSG